MVLALGDIERPVYPRSAVKGIQALVLIESGGADKYQFSNEELALACASHSGEPGHVAGVEHILGKAGLDAAALRCGAHWPMSHSAGHALARTGIATALHNNCSGKHAGFLCVACALDAGRADYLQPAEAVQRLVQATLQEVTGMTLAADAGATDGCSAPTWAMPLAALARGFARFGTGLGLAPERAKAAVRLRAACAAHPWHVGGSGRFDTEVMQRFGERVFVKTGAEGVYCAALPEQGLGIAVKCDDGAGRAAEVMMAALLARFLPDADAVALEPFVRPMMRNWNGIAVGSLRPTDGLTT
jgi:L-asparaginase II